jgi:hypothetical protein
VGDAPAGAMDIHRARAGQALYLIYKVQLHWLQIHPSAGAIHHATCAPIHENG